MPKVRFCPDCHNNFSNYNYLVEKENDKPVSYLVYSCQSCLYQEKVKSVKTLEEATLFTKNSLNKLPDKEIRVEMSLDKTLPRTREVECPNNECPSNNGIIEGEVVFFHYNTDMKLAYICCRCNSTWKVD